jgi:GTPase SAR1 family protein
MHVVDEQEEHGREEDKDYVYKIIVVGDLGCGKTSIIQRFVRNKFSKEYKATVCQKILIILRYLVYYTNSVVIIQCC